MNRLQIVNNRIVEEIRPAILNAQLQPDPVKQRQEQVRIARELRSLADHLDDYGRLTE